MKCINFTLNNGIANIQFNERIINAILLRSGSKAKTGLLNHLSLSNNEGIIYKNKHIFHTFGMNFPIEVACFDKNLQQIDSSVQVEANRVFLTPLKSKYTLEISVMKKKNNEENTSKIKVLKKPSSLFVYQMFSKLWLISVLILSIFIMNTAFSSEKISLNVGRIKMIDLIESPETVQVSDPDVIEVERVGVTNSIKVIAKATGQSRILAKYANGNEKIWELIVAHQSRDSADGTGLASLLDSNKDPLDLMVKNFDNIQNIKLLERNSKIIITGKMNQIDSFQKLSNIVAAHPTNFFPIYSIAPNFEKILIKLIKTKLDLLGEKKLSLIKKSSLFTLTGVPSSASGRRRIWEFLSGLIPNIVNAMSDMSGQSSLIQINLEFLEVSRSENLDVGFKNSLMEGASSSLNFSPIDTNTGYSNSPILNIAPLNILFKALKTKSFVKNIAKPVILTRSGEKATFLAGGEMPIVSSISVNSGVASSVNYKSFGIGFDVTPTLQSDGDIWIKLDLNVSDIAESLFYNNVPGFTTRKLNTNIILSEGNSAILSGLVQNKNSKQVSSVPWLSSVPILGELFKSRQFQDLDSELWVSITATKINQESDKGLISFTK